MQISKRRMEHDIVSALIKAAIADGYSISVYDGDAYHIKKSTDMGNIIDALFSVDEEYLHLAKEGSSGGVVMLVYGNDGWDVIADYTGGVEHLMVEPDKLSAKYQEEYNV